MESTIHWVYGSHGQTSEVPLNFKPAHNEFYPFLGSDLHTFFENYLDSDEAVLILIGPPGTGKTTFIKNLLHFGKGDALVTFDPNIMASDSLFARFIDEAEIDFLVMEDADAFLKSRTDGNQMMHKFLNVSDGLISTRGKKLIFSTNLPSINDIDDALLRPGRCFKVIEFRQLTRDEANKLNDVVPVNLTNDQEKFTLAELMSTRTAEQKAAVVKSTRTMGFY
jgi:ATP-dependent 26S proteasome regulatory subunit